MVGASSGCDAITSAAVGCTGGPASAAGTHGSGLVAGRVSVLASLQVVLVSSSKLARMAYDPRGLLQARSGREHTVDSVCARVVIGWDETFWRLRLTTGCHSSGSGVSAGDALRARAHVA